MEGNLVETTGETVAVIGTGLIGRGWAIVFARAGYTVRMYDAQAGVCDAALAQIELRLRDLERFGLVSDPAAILARLEPASSLAGAVRDAELVQECALETLSVKRALFEQLDRVSPRGSILASSSSAIVASAFTDGLPGRERCLVGHPANPPYLMPIVEVVPSQWTSADVTQRAVEIYRRAGQEPIVVKRELHGFILNRLQGALLNEAFRLVDEGYVDTEAIDKTVAFGLGLRWSFMGPFETIDLNASGGIADYAERYGDLYFEMTQHPPPAHRWSDELIQKVEAERRAVLPDEQLGERSVWRDRRLMLLMAHKAAAAGL